jgi:gluconate 2-dehydrogenase gamma chain
MKSSCERSQHIAVHNDPPPALAAACCAVYHPPMRNPSDDPTPGPPASRRDFLALLGGAAGAAWLASLWPTALADAAAAQQAAAQGQAPRFRVLTPWQAADFGAFADRIIPADDTPGARDSGVVHFVDGMLATLEAERKADFERALAELHRATRRRIPRGGAFATLPAARQDEILKSMESSPGFATLRIATLAGYLSHPSYGGNRNAVAWKAIGFEDRMTWQPPFGYYDRPEIMAQLLPRRRR